MRGKFHESPNMIRSFVPEVGADRQDGAAEPASPRLPVDVAVSRTQETGALVAGETPWSGTHAHAALRSIRPPKLLGRTGPVVDDVLTRMIKYPIHVPKATAGGLSAVFRRERR